MYTKTLSVSELNNYMKKIIDCDFILNNTNIKGEISNFKEHSSGHLYFSLKDEKSKINCIMFRNYASELKFMPQNGELVVVKGKVSVYEKEGTYQIYCHDMEKQGIGDLFVAFDKLKSKLEKEGLFDDSFKKSIPKYPRRVGVITSPTGAAIRDIINVALRRNRSVELVIYPALVQGDGASKDLIKGIETFNAKEDIDTIILARGGGSIEELWAFNNEELARTIFKSKKPIITGVGHETDFTLVDFVSDRRASTPSSAAEIAIPSAADINYKLDNISAALKANIYKLLRQRSDKVNILNKSLEIHSPMNYIVNQYNYISSLQDKLGLITRSNLSVKKEQLSKIYSVINAHNPLSVLGRGYAVIEDMEGKVISEKEVLKNNSVLSISLKDGKVKGNIEYIDD